MIGLILPKGWLGFALTPQILPRVKQLCFGGFGAVPYFIAVVYQMVGLLPAAHPYLSYKNVGRFGIRHVISEAARHLTFSWKHIDQIIMFFAVLVGLTLFVLQIFALASLFFMQPVLAGPIPTSYAGFLTLTNPQQDLAFMMLDMVFGVPHPNLAETGFFQSCVSTAAICEDNFGVSLENTTGTVAGSMPAAQFGPLSQNSYTTFPFPIHDGLHRLFSVYSQGLLIVAVMMTVYFIVTIVGETAQTGTPFGKRYNKAWAPLRLVIAFGLLLPLAAGLNSAQYLVLFAAKTGSAFATNGWHLFNDRLATAYRTGGVSLVSVPNIPELDNVIQFMYTANACRHIYDTLMAQEHALSGRSGSPDTVQPYLIREQSATVNVLNLSTLGSATAMYDRALSFLDYSGKPISVTFGVEDAEHTDKPGSINPVCGKMVFEVSSAGTPPAGGGGGAGQAQIGPYLLQRAYFELVMESWASEGWISGISGAALPAQTATSNRRYIEAANREMGWGDATSVPTVSTDNVRLDQVFIGAVNAQAQTTIAAELQTAVAQQATSARWLPTDSSAPLYSKGWAAGGIWYNRISEMNGVVTASAFAIPRVVALPQVIETVKVLKKQQDKSVDACEATKPVLANSDSMAAVLSGPDEVRIATALYNINREWNNACGGSDASASDNPFIAMIEYILGTDGLYNMRSNPDTHPLAMLSGVGRSLVESSINSIAWALGGATGLSIFGFKASAKLVGSFLVMAAMIGLTVGVILFYIIPFLPFIYFFFAVGGWVKGIFEALVGVPLWALAHIRIDGPGMSGQAAQQGYYLIFEVFLRPILIVFGLVASVSIFSALVSVLNNIFDLVVVNSGGFDVTSELSSSTGTLSKMRGAIDQFFFTVMYAVIVYMVGVSSFKMVDLIPNNILRWMGQSVTTFNDKAEDPTQGLVGRATLGSQQITSKMGGGLQKLVGGIAK